MKAHGKRNHGCFAGNFSVLCCTRQTLKLIFVQNIFNFLINVYYQKINVRMWCDDNSQRTGNCPTTYKTFRV